MPAIDARGLSVSGADSDAAAAMDYFVSELLGNGAEPGAVMKAAETHPRCPLLQAYAASLYVFAQSPSGAAPGLRWLERAQAQADNASEHERAFMSAVEAGLGGDLEAAIDGHEAIAQEWPRETVSAKLAEFHLFETGDCRRQRRIMQAYAEGRWDDAAAGFAPLLERSGEGGGSDEQRGVFDQSYLISLINGGEREMAREWLNGKIGHREPTPLEQHWLKLAG